MAAAKLCRLNYQFYEAFFYATKALLTYVKEKYYVTSFKEECTNSTRKPLVPKNVQFGDASTTVSQEGTVFEFVEDVVEQAVSIFENYYNLATDFTPNKIGLFLRKVQIEWS